MQGWVPGYPGIEYNSPYTDRADNSIVLRLTEVRKRYGRYLPWQPAGSCRKPSCGFSGRLIGRMHPVQPSGRNLSDERWYQGPDTFPLMYLQSRAWQSVRFADSPQPWQASYSHIRCCHIQKQIGGSVQLAWNILWCCISGLYADSIIIPYKGIKL